MSGLYYSDSVTRLNMIVGRTYVANFPNKAFLVLNSLASGSGSGLFELKLSYVDREGDELDPAIRDSLKNISINDNKT